MRPPKPIVRTCHFRADRFLADPGRTVCDDCGMNRKGPYAMGRGREQKTRW